MYTYHDLVLQNIHLGYSATEDNFDGVLSNVFLLTLGTVVSLWFGLVCLCCYWVTRMIWNFIKLLWRRLKFIGTLRLRIDSGSPLVGSPEVVEMLRQQIEDETRFRFVRNQLKGFVRRDRRWVRSVQPDLSLYILKPPKTDTKKSSSKSQKNGSPELPKDNPQSKTSGVSSTKVQEDTGNQKKDSKDVNNNRVFNP